MKAQQKKLSGCASNLLAHEDLGHLRKPIIGIYKPSSTMKIPTSIWKWQHRRLSIWRTWCYFEAQVWKKDSSIAPSLFFSHFFIWAFSLFLWPLIFPFFRSLIPTCGGIIVSIIFSSLGQCSNNDDHHTFIYLQLDITTRYLGQRYDSIWMPSAVYRDVQWSSVAMTSKKGQAMKTSC